MVATIIVLMNHFIINDDIQVIKCHDIDLPTECGVKGCNDNTIPKNGNVAFGIFIEMRNIFFTFRMAIAYLLSLMLGACMAQTAPYNLTDAIETNSYAGAAYCTPQQVNDAIPRIAKSW